MRTLSIGHKLTALAGTGVIVAALVSGIAATGVSRIETQGQDVAVLQHAQTLLLRLDTRSSELKVDGYKAAVRPDASEGLAELEKDIATPMALLAELQALPLPSDLAGPVADIQVAYTAYAEGIEAYVDSAIADQAVARAAFQDIQTANDGIDDILGGTINQVAADQAAMGESFTATVDRVGLLSILATVLGLAVLVGLSVVISRSIRRPLAKVKAALQALAEGDLTASAGLTTDDELGDTAGAIAAIAEISTVIGRMNDFQTTIASAVEEQTATTNEMSRNVAQAATGSNEIASNIVTVATAAEATSTGVGDSQRAADELARMSSELQSLVSGFRR